MKPLAQILIALTVGSVLLMFTHPNLLSCVLHRIVGLNTGTLAIQNWLGWTKVAFAVIGVSLISFAVCKIKKHYQIG